VCVTHQVNLEAIDLAGGRRAAPPCWALRAKTAVASRCRGDSRLARHHSAARRLLLQRRAETKRGRSPSRRPRDEEPPDGRCDLVRVRRQCEMPSIKKPDLR
jgi:hypothetical protein